MAVLGAHTAIRVAPPDLSTLSWAAVILINDACVRLDGTSDLSPRRVRCRPRPTWARRYVRRPRLPPLWGGINAAGRSTVRGSFVGMPPGADARPGSTMRKGKRRVKVPCVSLRPPDGFGSQDVGPAPFLTGVSVDPVAGCMVRAPGEPMATDSRTAARRSSDVRAPICPQPIETKGPRSPGEARIRGAAVVVMLVTPMPLRTKTLSWGPRSPMCCRSLR